MKLSKIMTLILVATIAFSAISCQKDSDCKGIVTVVFVDENDNKVPVPGCKLVFGDTSFAKDVYRIAVTDVTGKYEGTWKHEAHIRVVATAVVDTLSYQGANSLKLVNGETTELELFIKPL